MTGENKWGRKIEGGWFDEEHHIYRCDEGIIRPSSTQVFDILGMIDFGNAKPEVLEFKQKYGTALHAGVQLLAKGDLDWDTVDDRLIAPLAGVEQYLKDLQFEVDACEEPRVHSLYGMKYGMTLDLRGSMTFRGIRRHAVVDLKTGIKFSPTWEWQLGSYVLPQEKVDKGWLGVIFQIHPDGRVLPHYLKDVEAAKRDFQTLLASALIKVNAGLARIGKAA